MWRMAKSTNNNVSLSNRSFYIDLYSMPLVLVSAGPAGGVCAGAATGGTVGPFSSTFRRFRGEPSSCFLSTPVGDLDPELKTRPLISSYCTNIKAYSPPQNQFEGSLDTFHSRKKKYNFSSKFCKSPVC